MEQLDRSVDDVSAAVPAAAVDRDEKQVDSPFSLRDKKTKRVRVKKTEADAGDPAAESVSNKKTTSSSTTPKSSAAAAEGAGEVNFSCVADVCGCSTS
jgi:hypothetical protein